MCIGDSSSCHAGPSDLECAGECSANPHTCVNDKFAWLQGSQHACRVFLVLNRLYHFFNGLEHQQPRSSPNVSLCSGDIGMSCNTQLPLLQAQTLQNEPSLVLAVLLSLMEGCECSGLCSAPPTSNLLEASLFQHPPPFKPNSFRRLFFFAVRLFVATMFQTRKDGPSREVGGKGGFVDACSFHATVGNGA